MRWKALVSHAPVFEVLEARRLLARSLGIDVSDYQGDITVAEWTQIKNSGRDFAFTKATEGVTFDATTFVNNMTRAKQAGVLIGAYHYGRPDNNAATADADHFITRITPYLTSGYLRPVLDVEVDAGDITFMSNWVNAFCNRVKTVTGITPLVYTGQFFASSNFNSTVTQWPLWIAQWPTNPNPQTGNPAGTTPWPTWNFWQYSSTGTVPGISGNVDLDVYNGTLAQLQTTFVINPDAEVTVLQGATPILNGQVTPINFGSVMQNQTGPSIIFTVRNDGGATLNLGPVNLPAGYTLTDALVSTLSAGASDNFTVRLDTLTPGTKSGNVSFTTNDPNENPFTFPITGIVTPADIMPPTVNASSFLFATAPHKLAFQFSEDVSASLQPSDLTVREITTQASIIVTGVSWNGATNTATFTLNNVVPDGSYRATLSGSGVTDLAGNPLGADHLYDFFFLAGDANHDGTVNLFDFNVMAANFGQTPRDFTQGDFNYDTIVNLNDFNILAGNFGHSAAPAATSTTPFGTTFGGASIRGADDERRGDDALTELLS